MGSLRFSWDSRKARSNVDKHGVTFGEATTVFYDDQALYQPDPDHSETEERFIILGLSAALRILVVCHFVREEEDHIRLISARKATKKERNQYARRYGK